MRNLWVATDDVVRWYDAYERMVTRHPEMAEHLPLVQMGAYLAQAGIKTPLCAAIPPAFAANDPGRCLLPKGHPLPHRIKTAGPFDIVWADTIPEEHDMKPPYRKFVWRDAGDAEQVAQRLRDEYHADAWVEATKEGDGFHVNTAINEHHILELFPTELDEEEVVKVPVRLLRSLRVLYSGTQDELPEGVGCNIQGGWGDSGVIEELIACDPREQRRERLIEDTIAFLIDRAAQEGLMVAPAQVAEVAREAVDKALVS